VGAELRAKLRIIGGLLISAVVMVAVLEAKRNHSRHEEPANNAIQARQPDRVPAFSSKKNAAFLRATSPNEHRQAFPLLNTDQQRQEFYNVLVNRSPDEIYELWRRAATPDLDRHKGLIEFALSTSLKQSTGSSKTEAVYRNAEAFLNDEGESESDRIRLVKWLGQAGTSEALTIFLQKLESTQNDRELRTEILRQLSEVGNSRWNRRVGEALSTQLEEKWKDVAAAEEPDLPLLAALAQGLARLGEPSGLSLLLDELGRSGKNAQKPQRAKLSIGTALAFRDVRSDSSVPLLNTRLLSEPLDSLPFLASGEGLVAIGTERATKCLVDWAERADETSTRMAEYLFSKLWHPAAIKEARLWVTNSASFRSPVIRTAIEAALGRIP
jgi:hypothetical protein